MRPNPAITTQPTNTHGQIIANPQTIADTVIRHPDTAKDLRDTAFNYEVLTEDDQDATTAAHNNDDAAADEALTRLAVTRLMATIVGTPQEHASGKVTTTEYTHNEDLVHRTINGHWCAIAPYQDTPAWDAVYVAETTGIFTLPELATTTN